jgi:hypothetical protein
LAREARTGPHDCAAQASSPTGWYPGAWANQPLPTPRAAAKAAARAEGAEIARENPCD